MPKIVFDPKKLSIELGITDRIIETIRHKNPRFDQLGWTLKEAISFHILCSVDQTVCWLYLQHLRKSTSFAKKAAPIPNAVYMNEE